jgi:hypothetical protein
MTATCRAPCCSATPRRTVSELFERGFHRNRKAPLPIEGISFSAADGYSARFSVAATDGRLADIAFRASSCATLIAYCELIAEMAQGFRIEIARGLTATDLIETLPGVPSLKRERAVLAIAAFRAVLFEAERAANSG